LDANEGRAGRDEPAEARHNVKHAAGLARCVDEGVAVDTDQHTRLGRADHVG
jgi:hypothetical protein